MIFCTFLFYYRTNSEYNGIFKSVYNEKIVVIDVSGSSIQMIEGQKQMTKPEYAINPVDKDYDWCSNCGKTYEEHPWITFSMKQKKFKFNGYFIRCGCCYAGCCCEEAGYCAHCCLYSWSLQISNDNVTWTDIHKVEKDRNMMRCNEKSYKLDKEYTARYVRIIQNDACPGEPPCIAINKMDFFGSAVNDDDYHEDFVSFHDDDDDVSIIGHISKNGNVALK